MGLILCDCPHCGAAKVGMATFGVTLPRGENVAAQGYLVAAAAICGNCGRPISAMLASQHSFRAQNDAVQFLSKFNQAAESAERMGLELISVWPRPPQPDIPRHLPPEYAAKLDEAERSFAARIPTGAAGLYRSLVDMTTRRQLADGGHSTNGSLKTRIDKLAELHCIPQAVADWAHEVRVIGNDGLHDEPTVSADDAAMARSFALTYLRYAFELPGDIAARRTPAPDEV